MPSRPLAWTLLLVLLTSSCAYRLLAPRPPQGGVQLSVANQGARLVASQSLLHRAVADAMVDELGWPLRPGGRARLTIVLHEEDIEDSGADGDDITVAWRATLHCTATWFGHGTSASSDFEATASYTSLDGEQSALESACESLADSIVNWLAEISTR